VVGKKKTEQVDTNRQNRRFFVVFFDSFDKIDNFSNFKYQYMRVLQDK